jgi:hypothetical protein
LAQKRNVDRKIQIPKFKIAEFGRAFGFISLFSICLEFECETRPRYGRRMDYTIVDLNDYEEDEDFMDLDIEAVQQTKIPFVLKRFAVERYYYCRRCSEMHSFTRCATAPAH